MIRQLYPDVLLLPCPVVPLLLSLPVAVLSPLAPPPLPLPLPLLLLPLSLPLLLPLQALAITAAKTVTVATATTTAAESAPLSRLHLSPHWPPLQLPLLQLLTLKCAN